MRSIPCHLVDIVTPKRVLLNGLIFGPQKPERVFIFVHGLTGSAFSMAGVRDALVSPDTGFLTFNNRGFETVAKVKKLPKREGGKPESLLAGCAHETFTECTDDIAGAVACARETGAKEVYLVGHSTGAQKIVYALTGSRPPQISGAILLGPLSDYAGVLAADKCAPFLKRLTKKAKELIAAGKPHELLPPVPGFPLADAQRFLSLYTPDSPEELFPYAQKGVKPKRFARLTLPLFVAFAEKDEYADRPAEELERWFREHSRSARFASAIIPDVGHSFKGGETQLAEEMRKFLTN